MTKKLTELHNLLAEKLLDKVKDPDCKSADLNVARRFLKDNYRKIVQMSLHRNLRKEVNTGANGTQDYIIKKGINKDKLAKKL